MLGETNMKRNLSEANKRERETKRIPAGHNLSPNYTTLVQGFDVLGLMYRIEQSELTSRAATAIQREG